MKKYILVFALLAVALAGCGVGTYPGNEIACGQDGQLFYHYAGSNQSATSLSNKRQFCTNQPDGSIVIKYKDEFKSEID